MIEQNVASPGDSFLAFLQTIRRHWAVIIACLIIAPCAAYLYTRTQQRKYTTTASILVNSPSVAAGIAGTSSGNSSTADTSTALSNELSLASLNNVSTRTANALGAPYAGGSAPGSVSVNNDGSSTILTVKAVETNPALAARVANTYARQFIQFRVQTNVALINKQRADLAAQLAAAPSQAGFLQPKIASLRTLASLQNGNMQLVGLASPPGSPSSPHTASIVAGGAALGLVVGILLAIFFGLFDRRLKSADEVQEILHGPILGAIPRSRALASVNDGRVLEGVDLESFSMIYANMSNYHDQPIRSVLVTSATGGDGKSTVAWNLATTAAAGGARVLLIEADMRHPSVGRRLGANSELGLIDVLQGKGELQDAVLPVTLMGSQSRNGAEHSNGGNGWQLDAVKRATVFVLFAGSAIRADRAPTQNPMAMLSSDRARDLIAEAESLYDLVVIDAPPASVVPDAIPLVKHVSGVIVVTRMNSSTRGAALQLRSQLEHLQANVLGIVVNAVDSADSYYESVSSYIGA